VVGKLICAAYIFLNTNGVPIEKTKGSDLIVKRFEQRFGQCVSLLVYRESNGHFFPIPKEPLK